MGAKSCEPNVWFERWPGEYHIGDIRGGMRALGGRPFVRERSGPTPAPGRGPWICGDRESLARRKGGGNSENEADMSERIEEKRPGSAVIDLR